MNEELTKRDCGLFPTLAFDLFGQLLFCENGFRNTLSLPSPMEYLRLSPYEENGSKYPWGVNYLQLQTYISSVIHELPPRLAAKYKNLYPGNIPVTIDEIASPFNGKAVTNTDKSLIKIIRSLENPSISSDTKESNRKVLYEYGIYEIPTLPYYHSKLHQSLDMDINDGGAIDITVPGWFRGTKVLTKSNVALKN
jgi:hypothetical protein